VRANDPGKAIEVLQQWLTKNPDDGRTRFFLASLLMTNNRNDEAMAEHETLLKQDANNAVLLNNLAWLYGLKKDPRALDYAEKAFAIAPTPNIGDTLAWLLVQKGDTERALPILAKATTDAPAVAQIRYHYAVALKNAGRASDAKRELEAVVKANQPSDELSQAKTMLKELGG
jgi:Flp pilus assembly protein TadD